MCFKGFKAIYGGFFTASSGYQNKVQAGHAQSFSPVVTGLLQRMYTLSNTPGLVKDRSKRDEEELTRQRSPVDQAATTTVPSIVHEVLSSPGQPLDTATRSFMEPRFGHDFDKVRVHTDAKAAESARAVNARAYTMGRDVVFGSGQFAPATDKGRQLLSHELTHVLQQRLSLKSGSENFSISQIGDEFEHEAEQLSLKIESNNARQLATSRVISNRAFSISTNHLPTTKLQRSGIFTPLAPGGGFGGLMERDRRRTFGPPVTQVVYMCSKSLERAPLAKHAFFRVGGSSRGNPTYSLEPVDRGNNCYQGDPKRNFPADFNADGSCIATSIHLSCLTSQFASYPVGHYCTWGPNSNTFVGQVARNCGISNPDPPGWTPGIDDSPPPSGTFAPSPERTLVGCVTKQCD